MNKTKLIMSALPILGQGVPVRGSIELKIDEENKGTLVFDGKTISIKMTNTDKTTSVKIIDTGASFEVYPIVIECTAKELEEALVELVSISIEKLKATIKIQENWVAAHNVDVPRDIQKIANSINLIPMIRGIAHPIEETLHNFLKFGGVTAWESILQLLADSRGEPRATLITLLGRIELGEERTKEVVRLYQADFSITVRDAVLRLVEEELYPSVIEILGEYKEVIPYLVKYREYLISDIIEEKENK